MTFCFQGLLRIASDFATTRELSTAGKYLKILRFPGQSRVFLNNPDYFRSYAQKGDRCYLSGDDSSTLTDVPQPVEIGAVYKEKVCTRSEFPH